MELWLWCMSCNYASPINLPSKFTEGIKIEQITLPFLASESIRKELIPFDNDRFVKSKIQAIYIWKCNMNNILN